MAAGAGRHYSATMTTSCCIEYDEVCIHVTMVGEGTNVVMLPSLGRDIEDFLPVARLLATRGCRVLMPSPRGIGLSRGPLTGITLGDLARDVAEVIGALGSPQTRGKALVAGHAFGNWVARMTAASHPDRVFGVALLAAAHRSFPSSLRDTIDRIMDSSLPADERLDHLRGAFFAPGHDPVAWLQGWHPEAAHAQRAAGRATPRQAWWGAGDVPLLDVQAEHDPFAPRSGADDLGNELGARVQVARIADAGHALLPEQPAAVADALIRFLIRLGRLPDEPMETSP